MTVENRLQIYQAELNTQSNWLQIFVPKTKDSTIAYLRFVVPVNEPIFQHPDFNRFVARGLDLQTGKPIAIKVQSKSDDHGLHEARAMHTVTHPNAMPLLGFAETDDAWLIVMPLYLNESLDKKIQPGIGIGNKEKTVQIVSTVAQFLDYLHAQNIHHGSLDPGDIYDTDSGIVVGDFGLCSIVTREFYPDRDISALRSIAHTLSTGRSFSKQNYPQKPTALEQIIHSNHYQTAMEFANAFAAAVLP